MNENYRKAQRLIREGYMGTQDKFIEVMMEIKKKNPDLSHGEIMDLFQSEVDKFIKFHRTDRSELPKSPKTNSNNIRVLKDRIPMMKIPYGDKRKKGL
jgi:hypothetical protein